MVRRGNPGSGSLEGFVGLEIALERPSVALEASYLAGFRELETPRDQSAWIYLGDSAPLDLPTKDFSAYVAALLEREHTPPPGWVPDTVYWAVSEGRMVGRISIRHELSSFLRRVGGHVGYIVRPSMRRRGVATEMLRLLLETPRAKATGDILLTCNEDNVGSEKSILKNGGVFSELVEVGPGQPKKKHFWIKTSA